jgi:hypothetical protein
VAGDGDLDLVFLFGWPTHLGLMWENPAFAGFLDQLGSFSRLILVDRLGNEDELDDVGELLGDDVSGIAVHIAARVLAQAGAGEILCSRAVKDLVAGSGFAFADRGTHRLKGVPDSWQLYAVEPAGS